MAHPTGADELGALIGEHGYDWERARRGAVGWLVVGVLGTAIGVPVAIGYISDAGSSGFSPLPGLVLGLGLLGLAVGGTLLARSVTRRREVFRLHEGGLVHHRADAEHVLAWQDIARVDYQENDRAAARSVGTDVRCLIHLKAGGRLRVTGYHDNAHRLGSTLWRAIAKGEPPTTP
ncbi:hypothetical protein OHA74_53915 [Streptomyces phaeochromogenes]|uniref:hypothetical protein n=1 Tax=Streptomyces phaeochromogenes TaxID=1923 RepID=UPI002E2C6EF5|nr:hypothetical protein [Streptomyces phaeochromogenes]